MPNTPHGDTSYVFGIDAGFDIITGVKLESLSIDSMPEFEALAKDRTGKVVSHVVGGDKHTFTAGGFLTSGEGPTIGTLFDFDGHKFNITRVQIVSSNTEFEKVEISGTAYKLITA